MIANRRDAAEATAAGRQPMQSPQSGQVVVVGATWAPQAGQTVFVARGSKAAWRWLRS